MRTSALLLLLLTACVQNERTRSLDPQAEGKGFVVHEWGTYTSLQTSDGRSMDGLHHAEHLLPSFVHALSPDSPETKGAGPNFENPINQKLETPVLYFYDDHLHSASVKVGFPEGVISEWYPDVEDRGAEGEMIWQVELMDPASKFAPPEVAADGIWAPSRRVNALGVRAQTQDERFIFYRGLGRFERPFRVESRGEEIVARNDSSDPIAAAFLLTVGTDGGAIVAFGAITARGTETLPMPPSLEPIASYLAHAKDQVAGALIETGLYPDEARAMVDTWEHSYFTSPGTRVLYLAPRAWTDALLPISIEPAPDELVRTLVGRVEVLTQSEEQAVVARVMAAAREEAPLTPDTWGRFTEPRLRRAAELIEDRELSAWCKSIADTFATMP